MVVRAPELRERLPKVRQDAQEWPLPSRYEPSRGSTTPDETLVDTSAVEGSGGVRRSARLRPAVGTNTILNPNVLWEEVRWASLLQQVVLQKIRALLWQEVRLADIDCLSNSMPYITRNPRVNRPRSLVGEAAQGAAARRTKRNPGVTRHRGPVGKTAAAGCLTKQNAYVGEAAQGAAARRTKQNPDVLWEEVRWAIQKIRARLWPIRRQ